MDEKYVSTVITFLQQKLADSMLEAANLNAQLKDAAEKIAELEAGLDTQAEASK